MYTPKAWGPGDSVQISDMDHIETQFSEAYNYFLEHGHDSRYYNKTAARETFWYSGNDGSGSGADADLIYSASGNLHASSFAGLGIPAGLIIWWEDPVIPDGWHIANGEAGTRDLRDRFIIGAGTDSGYSVGDTGTGIHAPLGSISISGHALTAAEIAGHQHGMNDMFDGSGYGGPVNFPGSTMYFPGGQFTRSLTTGYSSVGKATADAHLHSGSFTGNNFQALPPSYALFCIQKL